MSQENKSGFAGCGGGCACAAKQAARPEEKLQSGKTSQSDVFSSVALASELLCPGDDYVDNIRSLWSSLAPCDQVFASGAKQWSQVNEMLDRWFVSGLANVSAAQARFDQAFPLQPADKNTDAEVMKSLRGKVDTLSELLFRIAPLYARENYFVSRGKGAEAEACVRERLELIENHLLPNLNFTAAEESQLRDDWFRVALNWTRAVASELK